MEIKIEHLSKTYGNQTVLDDISLHISSGTYGILGGNGAGKTTLMRVIAGIMEPCCVFSPPCRSHRQARCKSMELT